MKEPSPTSSPLRRSDTDNSRRPLLIQRVMIVLTVGLIGITFILAAFYTTPRPFDIRLNPYVLLAIAGTIACLWVFILVSRIKQQADELLWFALNIMCLGLWSAGDLFQYISATPATATFW